EHHEVATERDEVRDEGAAIPIERVEDRQGPLPADLLPGLEADPEDPARALSNRRAQAGGEELEGGDELLHALAPHDAVPATDLALVLHRVGGEERALSCEAELEPDLVVFGEALDVERELAVRERDL